MHFIAVYQDEISLFWIKSSFLSKPCKLKDSLLALNLDFFLIHSFRISAWKSIFENFDYLIPFFLDNNSPLAWKPSPWSLCSKSCGGGFQYRQVQCIMQFSERNNTQDVPESFCLSARIRKPSVQRKCGLDQCYSWIKSPWSKCANSDCVSRNKGQLKVEISLVFILNRITIIPLRN